MKRFIGSCGAMITFSFRCGRHDAGLNDLHYHLDHP
jgi:hypothetical protein